MRHLLPTLYFCCMLVQHSISSLPVLLQGKSFSVTCTISSLTSGNDVNENIQSFRLAHESYSTLQERAIIELYTEDDKSTGSTFYVDTKDQQENVLVLDDQARECSSTDIGEIRNHLLLDSLPFRALDTKPPGYVVGLAQVLYFIEAHRDQLQPLGSRLINNQNVTNYSFKYLSPVNGEWLKMEASYTGLWHDGLEVPKRVSLVSGNTSIQINYSNFDLINNYLSISEHKNSISGVNGVVVDKFAIPPFDSCIKAAYSIAQPIFEHMFNDKRQVKFSFEARFITRSLEARPFGAQAEFNHIVRVSHDGGLEALLYQEEDKTGVFKQLLNFRRLRMYQALQEFNSNSSSQCIVTKIPKPVLGITIGDLIVGASHFSYLGKSRVRGIPCRVYVARLNSLPYWMEQQIKFEKLDETSGIRSTDRGRGQAFLHVNELDLSPIRLVIHQEKTQHIIRFYNFVWDLDHSIRPSDQFSFEDICSSTKEARFQVEVAIVDDLNELTKRFNSTFELDSAFLRSVQDNLGVPISKIYQLETKLHMNSDGRDKLLGTFRVSGKPYSLTELTYVGQGYGDPSFSDSLYKLPVRSFQLCLWLSATKGKYFGYNAPQRYCVIDISNPDINLHDVNLKKPRKFIMDSASQMEIYQINTVDDPALKLFWVGSQWEHESSRRLFKVEALSSNLWLFGKSYPIDSVGVVPVGADTSEAHLISDEPRRFDGFGLKNERPNKLIQAMSHGKQVSDEQMSYERCHFACISDFRCQSFSVCLRNYQTECITSPVSFKGVDMTAVLDTATTSNFREKTKVVQLSDGSTVELVRHSNCGLYRKDFLELFKRKQSNNVRGGWLSHHNFLPVDDIDNCAKFCLDRNLEIFNKDIGLTAQLGGLVNGGNSELSSNQAQIQAIISKHKLNLSGFCFNFHFIENGVTKDSDSIERFCSISSDHGQESNVTFSDQKMKRMNLDIYEFKMSLFYESQAGIHLDGYGLGPSERATYVELKKGNPIDNEESYMTLLKLVEEGNNLQEYSVNDEMECSKACFMQSQGPWPSCRSFDIVSDLKTPLIECRLNSITLRQANSRKPNLVISNTTKTRKAVHYEPKLGFALDESLLDETLHMNIQPARLSDLWRLDIFLLTCTMCLAIVSSLAATYMSLKVMGKRRVGESELLRGEGE